ncbi:EamA-like transporter family protein [uncultured archaeon]|nr:EamA-like transporter family protein [uncultured archaeon]
MGPKNQGYIQLFIYSVLAGCIGIFVKLTHGMGAFEVLFFRAGIAAISILLFIIVQRRFSEISPVDAPRTLLIIAMQGLNLGLYFWALQYISVSNAVFLLYTAPVFSAILARVFLNEKIEKDTLIGIAAAIAGIVLIVNPSTISFGSEQLLGNLLGLGAGFFYAAMAVAAKPLLQKVSGYYMVFWQYFGIAMACAFSLTPSTFAAAAVNWWQLLGLGVLCTAIGYVLFMNGIRVVKAQHVFIITSSETIVATALGALILNEIPSWLALAGAALILYGAYRITRKSR